MNKKYIFPILSLFFISCKTTSQTCECPCAESQATQNTQTPSTQNLTSAQAMNLASQLFQDDKPEEALHVLNGVPEGARSPRYKKLRHDIINKIVMNMRYKVRILYEKSLLAEGRTKRDLLLQCKQILESIIKNYPEYKDMFVVKNNLKQIERELAKESST